jgi:hypothetical protein
LLANRCKLKLKPWQGQHDDWREVHPAHGRPSGRCACSSDTDNVLFEITPIVVRPHTAIKPSLSLRPLPPGVDGAAAAFERHSTTAYGKYCSLDRSLEAAYRPRQSSTTASTGEYSPM